MQGHIHRVAHFKARLLHEWASNKSPCELPIFVMVFVIT